MLQQSSVETINSFITPRGIQRTLQVEVEGSNVDIDFTLKNSNGEKYFKSINLNRRQALALLFYLLRILLPNKFLVNKWKREEKKEEKKENEC